LIGAQGKTVRQDQEIAEAAPEYMPSRAAIVFDVSAHFGDCGKSLGKSTGTEELPPPDADLGQHLGRAVYTGLLCSYRPDEPRRSRQPGV
jgi:hypothetical protein